MLPAIVHPTFNKALKVSFAPSAFGSDDQGSECIRLPALVGGAQDGHADSESDSIGLNDSFSCFASASEQIELPKTSLSRGAKSFSGERLTSEQSLMAQLMHIINHPVEDGDHVPDFVRDIKRSDYHFLEGFLGGQQGHALRAKHRFCSGTGRKSPISYYFDRQDSSIERKGCRLQKRIEHCQPQCPTRSSSIYSQSAISVSGSCAESRINAKLATKQREACESLRILIFGAVGNETAKESEKNQIFELQRGSLDEISKFVEVWSELDDDGSGDIDFGEFLDYFSRTNVDKLLCMRCVKYLLAKDGRIHDVENVMSRKASIAKCTREDMMKLLWLQAKDEDVKAMNKMFDLHRVRRAFVPAPKLLPKRKRRQLLENFNFLDKGHKGLISYADLVEADLVDEHMQQDLQLKYDTSGEGVLSADEFLEMLCPFGFQAHDRVKTVIRADDVMITKVRVDCRHLPCEFEWMTGWLKESDLKQLLDEGNALLRSSVPEYQYQPYAERGSTVMLLV